MGEEGGREKERGLERGEERKERERKKERKMVEGVQICECKCDVECGRKKKNQGGKKEKIKLQHSCGNLGAPEIASACRGYSTLGRAMLD